MKDSTNLQKLASYFNKKKKRSNTDLCSLGKVITLEKSATLKCI
jgi:hypothetical protein